MSLLQLFFSFSTAVFIVGTLVKAIKISRMPLHLRWDLYPIPHEKGKEHYGGSYYEEVNWWTKPANVSISNELKEMLKEIFFIQSMFRNNRPLWVFSFPFHFGLYLSIAFVLLVYAGAALGLAGMDVSLESASVVGRLICAATVILGVAGAILAALGALGLFFSRLFRTELRRTSVWTDYFNLLLLSAVFLTGVGAWAAVDGSFEAARSFIAGVVSFSPAPGLPPLVAAHLALGAVFLLWLPFTHMTHFVGKYFTYHKVRWEDHPNMRGSDLERSVVKALGYPITWSAPHIKTGATWAEAATTTDDREGN